MAVRSLEAGLCWCVEGSWRLCWRLVCWCVEGYRLCCVEGWCARLLKVVLKVTGCVVLKAGVLGCWRLCWRLHCVEGWCVCVLKVVESCVVLKVGMLVCWRLCWRLLCWCVEGCWRLCCVEGWCVCVLKVVESHVVFRLVYWYVEGCVEGWCVEDCWRLCCVEGWCISVLKARSPQWLQQGRWECKARLRWRTGVKWGRRRVTIWLNIYKDHTDCRVDSRCRLAGRKAEDKALQIKMTLAWIRMVAVIGRRDIRFFFFWPCHAACRILVPWLGTESWPQQWKWGVLSTGPSV